MPTFKEKVLETLHNIKGNGSFAFSNKLDFVKPGIKIAGVENFGFPISQAQIQSLINVAHKAPFGKGSKTVLDTTVRSAWEIDAEMISFSNPKWANFIGKIIDKTKECFGLEKEIVSASLYKMLIYEKGDFFLPHKDSEKELGMFGTLIIGLPAAHTGGQLHIRHDAQEEIVDFSTMANEFELPFVAFYADCEHEIKPITSGYRLCLVYNLVQIESKTKIHLDEISSTETELAKLLQTPSAMLINPIVVLLGHQYTPKNFGLSILKHHDKPRAIALLNAAKQAGYYAKLGLLTCFQDGELESDYDYYSYRNRNYDEEISGTMGEIYDEWTTIEHWDTDGPPPLDKLDIEESEIIADFDLKDGEPTEQESEGYTGNAGMSIQYWYHYGAVILWPKATHFDLLFDQNTQTKLNWLSYYLQNWEEIDAEKIKLLLINLSNSDFQSRYDNNDCNVIASILIKLADSQFILNTQIQLLLIKVFEKITAYNWILIVEKLGSIFENVFFEASKNIEKLSHVLRILVLGFESKNLENFVAIQIEKITYYLDNVNLASETNKSHSNAIVNNILAISSFYTENLIWINEIIKRITMEMPRAYVNKILIANLLEKDKILNQKLPSQLFLICKENLQNRVNNEPKPPTDWVREMPKIGSSNYYGKAWKILEPFMNSPIESKFEYRQLQALRSEMESAIKSQTVDLKMETIKKGSPHLLLITKTQASFEHEHIKWTKDVQLLKKLQEFD
jgi:2OG-Fe(II) oxygenase superfamily